VIEIILTLIAFLAIFFINKFKKVIASETGLIDIPDQNRKFHKKKTPLLGGVMIFLIFLLINLYLIFSQNISKDNFIIFLGCTGCFVMGLIDDKKNINYLLKFFFLSIIYLIIINLNPNLLLTKLYFHTFDKIIYLENSGVFITVLCLLLLTNALNLIDGINGLCISISIIFLTWIMIVFKQTNFFYLLLVSSLFYIFFLNLKKNIFLGDSGALFLGSLIGLLLISNYNNELLKNNFAVEKIFITLMLPGLDMLRVFSIRIINAKNPFKADRLHLHYLLIDHGFNLTKTLLVTLSLILIPIFINLFTNINEIKIVLSFALIYLFIIFYIKFK
jgi:UDP-GlcNAc:undecaprenyl-phosphate GlcNAc-1-phosphate transferase